MVYVNDLKNNINQYLKSARQTEVEQTNNF